MPESLEDEKASLERLLGNDVVVTPAALSAGLRWLLSKVRQELNNRPVPGEQMYLTAGKVAKRYGVSHSQAHQWMWRLRELGKVRVQVPLSGLRDKGDTLYYLPDIEAAFAENAIRVEKIKRGELPDTGVQLGHC